MFVLLPCDSPGQRAIKPVVVVVGMKIHLPCKSAFVLSLLLVKCITCEILVLVSEFQN